MAASWTYARDDPGGYAVSSGWSQGRLFPPEGIHVRLSLQMLRRHPEGTSTAVDVIELPSGDQVAMTSHEWLPERGQREAWLRRCAEVWDQTVQCFEPFP